jgi:hypothetical protein
MAPTSPRASISSIGQASALSSDTISLPAVHGPRSRASSPSDHVSSSHLPSTDGQALSASATSDSQDQHALKTVVNGGQRAPASGSKRQHSYWHDWWIWEILAGLLSFLCLLSICVVLKIYDGYQYPSVDLGLTLNATIALLTTIMKGAVLTLLAEGTSQLKWLRFAEATSHPLGDFNVYDAASRGGFGSIQLLWRLRREFWR